MAWQQTPFTVPLAVATASSLVIGLVAWQYRDRTGATPLAVLMFASAWWSVFYGVSLSNTDLAVKLAASKLTYLGIGVVPVAWLVFAAEYTGRLGWLSRRRIGLLSVVPAVSVVLVMTNELHGLVWATVETGTQAGVVLMDVSYGTWFWVHAAYLYLLLAAGTLLVLRMVVVSRTVYRGQAIALVAGVLVPWGANAVYLAGFTGPWDITTVGIVFSGAILLIAIFRHQLLDLVPAAREVAREAIIDSMTEAVIVVDRRGQVVDVNPAAEAVAGEPRTACVGRQLADLLPALRALPESGDSDAASRAEVAVDVDGEERTFDVRISPLRRGYGTITGRLITLRDVTDRIERERRIERQRQLLTVINRVLRHDIRTHMNLLLALADELRDDHPEEAALDRIVEKGHDVLDLSDRARDLERLLGDRAEGRTAVDLDAVVAEAVRDLAQQYPGVEFTVDGADRAEARAIGLIDSAVRNLLENAVEHNDRPDPRVAVAVSTTDGTVAVEIADNGPGLPAQERRVMATGTETALEHSSGLGLWLAYWIVTESGGELAIAENEPRGTVITLELEAT